MATIIAGSAATFSVQVKQDGLPLPVGECEAAIFSYDARTELTPFKPVDEQADGADWASGVVVVSFTAPETQDLPLGTLMLVLKGDFGIKRFKLTVETLIEPTRTSIFIRDVVIEEMRNDRLLAATAGALQDVVVSDDYLWSKIRAAESEMAHILRVPLVPTRFFPSQPTPEQIDALNGMAWAVESAPDYESDMFAGDRWGYIVTRQKPIIDVHSMHFVYPTQDQSRFEVPTEWLSIDKKYGHIRIVPTGGAMFTTAAGFALMGSGWSRNIPSMIHIDYTAGLTNLETNWPELLDAIKKSAVLKVVADAFLPQSSSISADGLSESVNSDTSKYHEMIERIINGEDGNGGLTTRIHGIRTMVI